MKKSQLRSTFIAASALSISIASHVHAVPAVYDSIISGNWNAAGSWILFSGTPVSSVPDTYLGETARILAGMTIDFDGGMSTLLTRTAEDPDPDIAALGLGAGSLAVANDGLILIDGGTLTQSVLNNEIRIGDGAGGAGTGNGTLTIRGGGTFNSGAALGVFIGSNLSVGGSGDGNGVVNIESGSFVMGAGPGGAFARAVLGVGVEGSTGAINVGDGAGGSAVLDLATNGAAMSIGGQSNPWGSTLGEGAVIVKSDGSILQGSGDIVVGDGGRGFLRIEGGSLYGASGGLYVGSSFGRGELYVLGGAVVNTNGDFVIGRGHAVGVVTICDSTFHVGNAIIGNCAGAGSGTTTICGPTTIFSASTLTVGLTGGSLGTFTISDGTVTVANATKIASGGATGNLNLDGGSLTTAGSITVADGGGTGAINQTNGNLNSGGMILGLGGGSTGSFTLSGGTVNSNGGHFQVGEGGNGTVNITAGTVSNLGWFHVASGVGSVGNLNVNFTNPADSVTASDLYLGNNGATGFATVTNGGLRARGVAEVGRGNGTGTLTVSGATSRMDAFTDGGLDGFFRVGTVGGHGIVNVDSGGRLNTNGGWFTLGDTNGSVGEATISGATSTLNSRGLIVGWYGSATGTLNIEDNAVVTNTVHELSVGRDAGGANSPTGVINISSGGVLNAGPETRIGHNATGSVNIDGGTINMQGGGWAILGEGGAANGTLSMTSGAVNVTADRFVLGQNAGAVGTFNQAGGATDVGNEFNVGRGGATGTLNLSGGTFNVHGWTTIGRDGAGTGTINVTNGAVFTHAEIGGDLLLGWNGGSTGEVNITSGGQMTYNWWVRAGIDAGSTGHLLVDGAGSILNHNNGTGGDSRLVTGEAGTGTLTVSNGGQIIDGGNGFFVGWHNTGTGTATVNTGGGVAVNNGWVQVGIEAGSHGSITVDGAGSTFSHDLGNAGFSTAIGQSGTGSLTISNGGLYDDTGSRFLVGRDAGGTGTLTVSGGSTLLHHPAVDPNNEDWMMIIGGTHEGSQPVGGTGLMNVTGGSAVQTNSIDIGRRSTGGGTLNMTDSAMTVSGHFSAGRGTNGAGGSTNGLVNLNNATLQYGTWLSVGHEGGSGVMNITNSTVTGSGDFNVGIDENGAPTPTVGVVNMNGGTVTVPTMPIGRNGGTGTFNLNLGNVTVSAETNIGNGAGTTGTLNISGPAAVFDTVAQEGNPRFFVGRGGGHGVVNVTNSGTLNTTNQWFSLGNGDGSLGEATVSGVGSTLNSEGLIVGWNLSGVGHLTISDNGVVNNLGRELSVGRDHSNTSGTITIDSGGTLNTVQPRIGHNGIGVVNINNGSLISVASDTIIGDQPTANGTVTMSGNSTFRSADHFYVGNLGTGTYTQTGGFLDLGVLANRRIQIGNQAGSTGTFNISGGTVSTSQWIHVGSGAGSTGTLNVNFTNPAGVLPTGQLYLGNGNGTGFATVTNGTLRMTNLAEIGRYGGTGTLNVTGANSSVEAFTAGGGDGAFFKVGGQDASSGHGIVNVTAGGKINTNGGWFTLGQNNGSLGEATISGTGSTLTSRGLIVGWSGTGAGTLNIEDNAVVNNSGHEVSVGRDWAGSAAASPTGTINITSGGVLNAGPSLRLGHSNIGVVNMANGTLNNTDGWAIIGGDGPGGHGTLNMTDSVFNKTSDSVFLGWNVGNYGKIAMGGASTFTLDAGTLMVGRAGQGIFEQTGGATHVPNGWVQVAEQVGSSGSITVDGVDSTFDHDLVSAGHGTAIGQSGTGTLTISNGAEYTDRGARFMVGRDATGNGTLTVSGGSTLIHLPAVDPNSDDWAMYIGGTHEPSVASGGTGLMEVLGGSAVQTNSIDIGRRSTGGGTLNMTDSAMTVSGHFSAGRGTNGAGGSTNGLVNLNNATLQYGTWLSIGHEGGSGVMNITNSTVTGSGDFNVGIDQNGAPTPTVGVVNMNGGTVTVPTMPIGRNGGAGTFNLNSGDVTVSNEVNIGNGVSTTGTLTVSGPTAVFNAGPTDGNPHFLVGRGGGHGVVNVANSGTLNSTNAWFTLGNGDGSVGEANISGPGSTLNSDGLIVGWSGSGMGILNISDGAVVNDTGREVSIGRDHFNTVGIINITAGGTLNGPDFRIGHNGTGTINVDAGTINATSWSILASDGAGAANGTVNLTNGSAYNQIGSRMDIGRNGTGSMTLSNGSTYTHTSAGELNIGGNEGENLASHGTVTIDSTSSFSTSNFIRVGHGNAGVDPAVGTINLNGGTLSAGGWIGIGHDGGDGTLNMIGGTITAGSEFYVGIDDNGHSRTTTGTATISDGSVSAGTTVWIGRNGGTGEVTVTGTAATSLSSANEFFVGDGGVGSGGSQTTGVLTIDNPLAVVSSVNQMIIGRNGGLGTVNQTAGSVIETNQWLTLAAGGGSTGTYNISGGTVTANLVEVGADGTGTFNVSGTGLVTANQFTVGTRFGGAGVINVTAGGTVASNGTIFLGGDQGAGSGALNIVGGTVRTNNITASLGNASLLIDGGTLVANVSETDFLRGFTDSAGHSAIMLNGPGGTIDTNGNDVRIQAANVITTDDVAVDAFGGAILTKLGLGTLAFEPALTTGTLAIDVEEGTFSQQGDATIDALFIQDGAIYVVDDLGAPPPAPPAAAASFDTGVIAGVTIQGVPEPGAISMLLVSALGMLGRRQSRKRE